MTNDELDRLLRSSPTPAGQDDYWRTFSDKVSQAIRQPAERAFVPRSETASLTGLGWIKWSAFAACVVLAAAFVTTLLVPQHPQSEPQLLALRAYYRNMTELFPHQFEAVILSSEGVQLRLSDRADIPTSPPLYVRVCGPGHQCATAVTFSGQKINMAGTEFEVLASGRGEIFLLAKERVWAPENEPEGGRRWHVETGWLESRL
ncbi:MAG TPA: hypothetical protein VJS65_13185 [Verrucomicrobiae bacterium]|nr:hypothetical protein [Verrucomicrobiae bacterium]